MVVAHDPRWPAQFEQIASQVRIALGEITAAVEHIGSTAVPGLAAKPIIDLSVVVDTVREVPATVAALDGHGWRLEGDGGLAGREAFAPRADLPYHHLYVVVRGNRQHLMHTRFRDLLRQDETARTEYAALKHALAPLLKSDRVAYTEGKSALIVELLHRHGPSS